MHHPQLLPLLTARHLIIENTVVDVLVSIALLPSFLKMIIDAKTIAVTLIIILLAFYGGLQLVRSFALQIAQENHDANAALDEAETSKRLKREQQADAAAANAFAKVEPLLVTVAAKSTTLELEPGVV